MYWGTQQQHSRFRLPSCRPFLLPDQQDDNLPTTSRHFYPSVDFPTPKSAATRARGKPLLSEDPRSVLGNAPHRLRCLTLLLILFTMLDHLVGLLVRVFHSQGKRAKPVQVQDTGTWRMV
jgi:hypothetical protein